MKHQYLCSDAERVKHPDVASKDPAICWVLEKSHISQAARDLLPEIIRDCWPKHFFDTQISRNFVKKCIVDTTNPQAAAKGAGFGGSVYTNFVPFNVEEVYKMMGLLLVNGICPRPSVELQFEWQLIFGNEVIAKALSKQMRGG